MPIANARYRMITAKNGDKIRLAFVGKKVVEAKNMRTGNLSNPQGYAKRQKR